MVYQYHYTILLIPTVQTQLQRQLVQEVLQKVKVGDECYSLNSKREMYTFTVVYGRVVTVP